MKGMKIMAIKEFKDYPNTETPLSAENINEVITTILKILGLDVDTYNPSTEYEVDEFEIGRASCRERV